MNYLKDVVLITREKKIPKEKILYYFPKNISPYMEINQENINGLNFGAEDKSPIGVNPYFFNEKIFWDIMYIQNEKIKNLQSLLFNLLNHLIAEIDYLSILRFSDYEFIYFEKAIVSGEYGEKIALEFSKIDNKSKKIIIEELRNLHKTGNNMEHFISCINKVFKKSTFYDYLEEKNSFLIYIDEKETLINETLLLIIEEFFKPIGLNIYVYWEYHFFLINDDETSVIDYTRIF